MIIIDFYGMLIGSDIQYSADLFNVLGLILLLLSQIQSSDNAALNFFLQEISSVPNKGILRFSISF